MPFPLDDPHWMDARQFLEQKTPLGSTILAPNEFLEFFAQVYPYNITHALPPSHFDFIAFHKAMLVDVDPAFGKEVVRRFRPVFGNEVFTIYAKNPGLEQLPPDMHYVKPVTEFFGERMVRSPATDIATACAVVVTTANSSEQLERSLPQLIALGAPVLIVDDGSTPDAAAENQALADRYQVPLLRLPLQRGRPAALNAGLSYWLANPEIQWISCFWDSVSVQPDALAILYQIQDATERPLLTGYDAPEHPVFGREAIAGHEVSLRRSMPGTHLHGHRAYWEALLPIPTPDLRDGPTGRGTEEDWWITAWSPQSVTKLGRYVICVPGLVQQVDEISASRSTPAVTTPVMEAMPMEAIAPTLTPATPAMPEPVREPTLPPIPVAPVASAERSHPLDRVRVLLDGYNLEMASGTGIKTYGTSLYQALTALGASVDVLLSRKGSKNNKILDEILFFDNQEAKQNLLLELMDLAKGMIKASAGPFYKAQRRPSPTGFVVTQGKYGDDFLRYAESFNLPKCYKTANTLYKFLKASTTIHVPEKLDIWHVTYPLPISVSGTRKITTIHDLIPLRLPYATLDNKEHFYNTVADAIKTSSVIVTVSEHSKQDILTYFDIDPDRIVVTYQPIALNRELYESWQINEYLRRYGLEHGKYLLFVGALEPKKNVGRLIDAYTLIDTDMPLVIVGKKGWLWEDEIGKVPYLFESGSKKRIKMLEYVPGNSLTYLYQGAYCLVFPSLYEGFGLPPLEAMTFGCPVITSNVSSLPEVCRSAALYVDPYDVTDIQHQLENLLSDREMRDRLAHDGRQNAERFSMDHYLERLTAAYTLALGR